MIIKKITVFLFVSILCNVSTSLAETSVRVASWNIANLHHEVDVESRPGIGTKRTADDFEILKSYALDLNADVIALQEISTPSGALRILPENEYEIFMSGRYELDKANGIKSGIYTAVAVKKNEHIKVVEKFDVDKLGIRYKKDGKSGNTRWGTAVLVDILGEKIWILSVHLKSSCATTKGVDKSKSVDCKTLWKQRAPLSNWIKEVKLSSIPFIIAGDFNRRFRQFDDRGPLWTALNEGNLDEPVIVKHPEYATRKCPTRKGKSIEPIDWILLDSDIAHWYKEGSFWETRFKHGDVENSGGAKSQRLSDHCPIHIDLEF